MPASTPGRQKVDGDPPSIHQIKVTLAGLKPPVWRRLLVPSEITLDRLHDVIQIAMGWEDDHLHQFKLGAAVYSDSRMLGAGRVQKERAVRLSLVAPGLRSKLKYEYDFGDGWEHDILVEAIHPPEPDKHYPVCVAGERACPPEDCGGVWGYVAKLEALQDPGDPDHEDVVDWMGEGFDPEEFDLDEVNKRLARFH